VVCLVLTLGRSLFDQKKKIRKCTFRKKEEGPNHLIGRKHVKPEEGREKGKKGGGGKRVTIFPNLWEKNAAEMLVGQNVLPGKGFSGEEGNRKILPPLRASF